MSLPGRDCLIIITVLFLPRRAKEGKQIVWTGEDKKKKILWPGQSLVLTVLRIMSWISTAQNLEFTMAHRPASNFIFFGSMHSSFVY